MTDYEVQPLTPDTWEAFAGLAERHNGVWGGCWCTFFQQSAEAQQLISADPRAAKQQMVQEGSTHAALLFDGETAVAWCEYGTPAELPNIHHRKDYEAHLDVWPDYRLTCLFVDKRYRRRGLSALVLDGAIGLIARAGGGVVEGYPHDLTGRPPEKKMSSSFLYNGTRTLYERAGFDYVRPKGQGNCVMRRVVAAAGP